MNWWSHVDWTRVAITVSMIVGTLLTLAIIAHYLYNYS